MADDVPSASKMEPMSETDEVYLTEPFLARARAVVSSHPCETPVLLSCGAELEA